MPEISMSELKEIGPYIWELALAIIFTLVGLVISQNNLGKRERKRVLDELTNIQREMHRRATQDWKVDDAREVWMIALYFERVKTLKDMMSDRENLSEDLTQSFESYEASLRNFGQVWAGAYRRLDNFWGAYKQTYEIFRQLTRTINKHYVIKNEPVYRMLKESGVR